MTKIVEEFELYGKQYRLETGELAKQATGAVLVTCGETSVLVTAVVSSQERDYDFFPLTVDYIEKMYAVGRIPGGYLKREAKPSDHGTLVARMVDRPIRPGFPDGYKNEVHIVATPLVIDEEHLPDTICVAGASAALLVGGAPFDGPAAAVRIGRNAETGEFIVNPTNTEMETSDLELTIAGTADYISMVEAGADEISEEDMLAAMTFGQEAIAAFCEKQAAFLARVNPTPMEYKIHMADPSVAERVDAHLAEMSAALKDADKAARMGKVEQLKAAITENDFTEEERTAWGSDIKAARSTSCRATCPAFTEAACSSAARPRSCPCAPSACSTSGNASTPSGPKRASATCTSTTSRPTAPARPAAWAPRSAARWAMALSPSAPSCRCCPTPMPSPTPSAW